MKVAVNALGSPSQMVCMVSVDVKKKTLKNWGQDLRESRGGRPGLPVPNGPYGLCGHEATLKRKTAGSDVTNVAVDSQARHACGSGVAPAAV